MKLQDRGWWFSTLSDFSILSAPCDFSILSPTTPKSLKKVSERTATWGHMQWMSLIISPWSSTKAECWWFQWFLMKLGNSLFHLTHLIGSFLMRGNNVIVNTDAVHNIWTQIYVNIKIYTYVYTYVHLYICMYMYSYIYLQIYIYTYMHIYIYTYLYLYIYAYIHIYISIYIYIHMITYVHIYMYTYVHVFISLWLNSFKRSSFWHFREIFEGNLSPLNSETYYGAPTNGHKWVSLGLFHPTYRS